MAEQLLHRLRTSPRWPVGREISCGISDGDEEEILWVGKPWRRVELLIQRSFWKGESCGTTWTLSCSLGFRRLGWHFHWALTRRVGQDYSEERL